MGFELVIAAKQDPVETARALQRERPVPAAPPFSVATINVNGVFCETGASELVQRLENVLHHPADTVIVSFQDVACEDPQSLVDFVRWIAELRQNGHDVRIAAASSHIRALLAEHAISPDAVMHPAELDAIAGRRAIDTHR